MSVWDNGVQFRNKIDHKHKSNGSLKEIFIIRKFHIIKNIPYKFLPFLQTPNKDYLN